MSNQKEIIIIDDYSIYAEFVKNMLEDNGFKNVIYYDDAYKALDEIKSREGAFIICDYNLEQEMNGIQLLDSIEKNTREIKMVIATSDVMSVHDNKKKYPVIEKDENFIKKIIKYINQS